MERGSLDPIFKLMEEQKNLNICLLGYGGAGKAIAAFGKKYEDSQNSKYLTELKLQKSLPYSKVLFLSTQVLRDYIDSFDLIINATTVGTKESLERKPHSN